MKRFLISVFITAAILLLVGCKSVELTFRGELQTNYSDTITNYVASYLNYAEFQNNMAYFIDNGVLYSKRIITSLGSSESCRKIAEDSRSIRQLNNMLLYISCDNNKNHPNLYCYNIETLETTIIAANVKDYIIINGIIVFRANESNDDVKLNHLYYVSKTGSPTCIAEDSVYVYWQYEGMLYYGKSDGSICSYSFESKTESLIFDNSLIEELASGFDLSSNDLSHMFNAIVSEDSPYGSVRIVPYPLKNYLYCFFPIEEDTLWYCFCVELGTDSYIVKSLGEFEGDFSYCNARSIIYECGEDQTFILDRKKLDYIYADTMAFLPKGITKELILLPCAVPSDYMEHGYWFLSEYGELKYEPKLITFTISQAD